MGSQTSRLKFYLNNNIIKQTDTVSDLGITIDSNLKFKLHINNITCKAYQRLSHITLLSIQKSGKSGSGIQGLRETACRVCFYNMVTFILWWNLANWGCSKTLIFTKRIPGCHTLLYAERLALLKLQSLEHRRLISDLVMCFNIVHNNNCLNFNDLFHFQSQ